MSSYVIWIASNPGLAAEIEFHGGISGTNLFEEGMTLRRGCERHKDSKSHASDSLGDFNATYVFV